MLFNSFSYMVFLPLVTAVFFLLPHKFRWVCLLVFSYYFYMSWNPNLVILILFTTVTSYLSAVIISRTSSRKIAKAAMITGVALSLACLFMFKYFNFFQGSVVSAMAAFGFSVQSITLNFLLPVVISFYTFQTLSYVIDVYKGNMKVETHLGYMRFM
ncbi:MAG: hypothetical protein RSF00_08700 [Oscillospiraceae bacterium]